MSIEVVAKYLKASDSAGNEHLKKLEGNVTKLIGNLKGVEAGLQNLKKAYDSILKDIIHIFDTSKTNDQWYEKVNTFPIPHGGDFIGIQVEIICSEVIEKEDVSKIENVLRQHKNYVSDQKIKDKLISFYLDIEDEPHVITAIMTV